jgi:hypothetical protein
MGVFMVCSLDLSESKGYPANVEMYDADRAHAGGEDDIQA